MRSEDLFPEDTAEEIYEHVASRWIWVAGFPFPSVRFRCLCGASRWLVRLWSFFKQHPAGGPHRVEHRCNVSMKCTLCGLVLPWGIAITPEQFERHGHRSYWWREAKEIVDKSEESA